MEKNRTTLYLSPDIHAKAKDICRRDRISLSQVVEDLLRTWLTAKGPGNPQRPITVWIEGHPDKELADDKSLIEVLTSWAKNHRDEVDYKDILEILIHQGLNPERRVSKAEKIIKELRSRHIKVIH